MILELFVVLLLVALVAIGLGYFTGDPHYAYVGLFFLFVLGIVLFSNNVEYTSGMNVTTVGATTTVTYINTSFTGDYARWFGIFLSVASGMGMGLLMINFKRSRKS